MLHGVGALAACAGLAELYCAESFAGWDGPAVLGAAELEGLSQLTQLRTLKLRCHDRSAGGAHLAALLEARRWPQLVCLELAASVRVMVAAAATEGGPRHSQLHLPFLRLAYPPTPGHMQVM